MTDVENLYTNEQTIAELPIDHNVSGDMDMPSTMATEEHPNTLNTLDEPIRVTIMRDLGAIGNKFYHVFIPRNNNKLLKEWDLWGPLILCVILAVLLQGSGGPQFTQVFFIYWMGAVVVTLNIKLLGGNISFFQSICVLGYCVLPLIFSVIFCRILGIITSSSNTAFIFKSVGVLIGMSWSIFASTAFLSDSQPPNRKVLALYPIVFFYFVISWLVISLTPTL